MSRKYKNEMAKFAETFDWAVKTDINAIRNVIQSVGQLSLRAIGSGGSLTTANALCYYHQLYTGQLASVATPLEAIYYPLNSEVSNWLLTASGKNVDILAAAQALIRREPCQLVALCGRVDSPLTALCRSHPFVDLLLFSLPTGKDGFLATNSLLGFTTLIARAYAMEFNTDEQWQETVSLIQSAISPTSGTEDKWETQTKSIWTRPTTLVLHGPSTRIGAIDLESKFTEAAIGNLQIADYRNFAHGRHHWLAKHGQTSAVLAFITDNDRRLALKTLDMIPSEVPIAQITLPGDSNSTALLSLIAALRICGWAGISREIDPGRPGVPSFGRKLYRLALSGILRTSRSKVPARDLAAIYRKSGISLASLRKTDEFELWRSHLDAYRARLFDTHFAGVVLDYDGTLVEDRDRIHPPTCEVSKQLVRLIEQGFWIGVATGRGASVRRDLQACLPASLWERVLIGYYNGAYIAKLNDDNSPKASNEPCDGLRAISDVIQSVPDLKRWATQTNRQSQITLEITPTQSVSRCWEVIQRLVLEIGGSDLRVFRSNHSIDVVAPGVSKSNLVNYFQRKVGNLPLLTIGDQGRWPGNDYELLQGPYSLSVNKTSDDPKTCWNLALPGQRGPSVTLDYFRSLETNNGFLRFSSKALR